ncbi:MAG: tetratricopeptide repeat protein [Alistipes sp.]|nr:tetratricopeptide repeat protein [Alistipes sp.]
MVVCALGLGCGFAQAQETRSEEASGGTPHFAETSGAAPDTQDGAAASEPAADELWDAANTAYINGDFRTAAETYERLLAQGAVSGKLYYNLANACFKEDRLGKAILYYRRALRLTPGNGDIRYNLGVAEARTKDHIEKIPEFFFVVWMRGVRQIMSGSAWTALSLAALVCALALFLLYLLAQRLPVRKAGFYGTLAAAVVFVCATCFAAAERRAALDRTQAVVMATAVAVKSSPDKSATDLFVLHEGTVVRIADRLGEWCEIVIDDGKKGWLECRKIEVI